MSIMSSVAKECAKVASKKSIDTCMDSLSPNMYEKKRRGGRRVKKVEIVCDENEVLLEVIKEEKVSSREVEKQAKKEEKVAEREAAKQAKKEEKVAAREAAKEEKVAAREAAKQAKKEEKLAAREAAKEEKKALRKAKKKEKDLGPNIIQIEVVESLKENVDRFHHEHERAPTLDELNNMYKEVYA